jgi:hypothetical protein
MRPPDVGAAGDTAQWIWLLHCERRLEGEAFVLMQRARCSRAIRRSGSPLTYSEADVRTLLASLGEPADSIDALVTAARRRPGSVAGG